MADNRVEVFWTLPLIELSEWCGLHAQPDSPTGRVAEAILAARVQQEGVAAMVRVQQEGSAELVRVQQEGSTELVKTTADLVRMTRRLMVATWVLVVATLVVGLVASFAN